MKLPLHPRILGPIGSATSRAGPLLLFLAIACAGGDDRTASEAQAEPGAPPPEPQLASPDQPAMAALDSLAVLPPALTDAEIMSLATVTDPVTRQWKRDEILLQVRTIVTGIDTRWRLADIDSTVQYRANLGWDDPKLSELARACNLLFGLDVPLAGYLSGKSVRDTRDLVAVGLGTVERLVNDGA